MIYAHIFRARGGGFELHLSTQPNLQTTTLVEFHPTIRSAKASAKAHGAKPWNY